MPVSAGEIEKAESRAKAKAPRQHAEECRLEAAGHCRKAREADPKKGIRECASEPGTSDKTPSGWVIKQAKTGRVTRRGPTGRRSSTQRRSASGSPGAGAGS